jgi:hypothetical protein
MVGLVIAAVASVGIAEPTVSDIAIYDARAQSDAPSALPGTCLASTRRTSNRRRSSLADRIRPGR